MSSVFFEILLIILLVLLNGYFSLSEIALLSAKKSRLRQLSKQGNKNAQKALFLTRQSGDMLSTVQIGITMIGIFAGAYGGATLAEHMEEALASFPLLSAYSEPISVVVVVIVITFLSLVVGELVPKQIALSNPEKLSLRVAGPIKLFMHASAPLVKMLSNSTAVILRILRITPAAEQVISEEEITLLIAEGAESGIFERSEQKMVERIFHMGNRPIKDFMTPRDKVVWLDIHDSSSAVRKKITGSDRSVFPVCDGTIDKYLGAIEAKDVLSHLFEKGAEDIDLGSLVQPVLIIDADVPSLVAIERLKRSVVSIVLITENKAKRIIGIVSFHDILEEIVGEFKENNSLIS